MVTWWVEEREVEVPSQSDQRTLVVVDLESALEGLQGVAAESKRSAVRHAWGRPYQEASLRQRSTARADANAVLRSLVEHVHLQIQPDLYKKKAA